MIPPALPAGPLVLRVWSEDESGLYASLMDEEVFRFTAEQAMDEAGFRSVLVRRRADPRVAPFAICDPGGVPVGSLTAARRGHKALLSYWLTPHARGRGWASTALRAATAWVFDTWDVTEAELEIDRDNGASLRVAVAADYRYVGTRLTSICGGPAAIYRRERDPVIPGDSGE